jgi:hypothetical protein
LSSVEFVFTMFVGLYDVEDEDEDEDDDEHGTFFLFIN